MEELTHDISNDSNVQHVDIKQKAEDPSERHRGGFGRTTAKGMLNPTPGHANGKNAHPKIEKLVSTIIFSLTKESLQYMKGPDGEDALAGIITLLIHASSCFLATEEARRAIRVTAQEATVGLGDGLRFKLQELGTKLPRFLLVMGVVAFGAYAVMLAVGLLLCLWRFSLYGAVQEKSASLW